MMERMNPLCVMAGLLAYGALPATAGARDAAPVRVQAHAVQRQPTRIDVTLTNAATGPVSAPSIVSVVLDGTPGRFWAPLDLATLAPLEANQRTPLQLAPGETQRIT